MMVIQLSSWYCITINVIILSISIVVYASVANLKKKFWSEDNFVLYS
jgi:hypothetical protein